MTGTQLSFWILALFILYVYALYPLLIAFFARLKPYPARAAAVADEVPWVAIVVPVFNGGAYLQSKLDSLRAQDYPAERIHILMVSDGSTDNTNEILSQAADIQFIDLPKRRGKPNALNKAIEALPNKIDIVVMTDARQTLSGTAVSLLVNALSDPKVGIAGGELVLQGADGSARHISMYWRYEKWIRIQESRYFSTLGASGALYAIRRRDLKPLAPDTILDDFEIPIQVLRKGLRSILVTGARAYDQTETQIGAEWARKVRTLGGNFQSLSRNKWLLVPGVNPAFWQFFSHKFFRLLVPYMLLGLIYLAWLADGWLYQLAFWAQVLFYCFALIGLIFTQTQRQIKAVSLAVTFVVLNAAAVMGLINFLSGNYSVKWQKTQ